MMPRWKCRLITKSYINLEMVLFSVKKEKLRKCTWFHVFNLIAVNPGSKNLASCHMYQRWPYFLTTEEK